VAKKLSAIAWSNASPMLPIEATTPQVRRVRPKSIEVYRADSTGRRNTSIRRCGLGRQPGWMVTQTGRPAMRSPGRPPFRRDLERAFWRKIAEGTSGEDAAVAVGVSGPVGSRWFRERGGMPPFLLDSVTSRFLSFDEREVMTLLKAQGAGGAGDRPAVGPASVDRLP
jgi:hypothetical protein